MQGDEVLKKAGEKTHSKRLSSQRSEGRDEVMLCPEKEGCTMSQGASVCFGNFWRVVDKTLDSRIGREPKDRCGAACGSWRSQVMGRVVVDALRRLLC